MTDHPLINDMPIPARREISSIAFPYLDLDDAILVARAMHAAGGVPLERDQLAAALGQMPNSGSFNTKLSTARIFGLVDSTTGKYQLTELGFDILDSERERAAKAQAFLNVPLYRRAFEEFKGRQLPPRPLGLEQAFVNFGVSPKQKDKARQAFERSARLAGFYPSLAEDRLVQPVIGPATQREVEEVVVPTPMVHSSHRSEPVAPDASHHPFIVGLLERLPPLESDWDSERRAKWLQAAAQMFDLLYSGDTGSIVVEVRANG